MGAHDGQDGETHDGRVLVAVYASPLASFLLRWGRDLGYRTALVEPDPSRVDRTVRAAADEVITDPTGLNGAVEVPTADVVVTDHHRHDLGAVLAPLVRSGPRWIGIIGSPRYEGPHVAALRAEGLTPAQIATVHRPIGLDIGSKHPPEIAVSVLAGLLADRNGRSGGLPSGLRQPAVPGTADPGTAAPATDDLDTDDRDTDGPDTADPATADPDTADG